MLTVDRLELQHQVTGFAYKNHNRLSIIDPNNPANDIAGGSSNANTILTHFSNAHRELTERMAKLAHDPKRGGQSILEVIMAGNYSSFENQRNYLEHLSKEGHRPSNQSSRSARSYQPPQGQAGRNQAGRNQPPRHQHPLPPKPPQGRYGGNAGNAGSRKRR